MKIFLQHATAATRLSAETARKPWLRKLGWAGFVFFFAKGMAWLMLGWLAVEQMG